MPALTQPHKSRAIGKAALAFAAAEGAVQLYDRGRSWWHDHLDYTVTITERDRLYDDVHDWLLTLLPQDRQRSLMVTTRYRSEDQPVAIGEQVPERTLHLMFNDARERRIRVDGEAVSVKLQRPDMTGSKDSAPRDEPSKIVFTCQTQRGQRAVIGHIEAIHTVRSTERLPVLRMVDYWGSWRDRNDLPPRSLSSVALPVEQKARIVADLAGFLDAESTYNRLAIPWHRGYMFHGPPGGGKTSLVKALSTHFGLDLWYVGLSDLKAEAGLMQLLAGVGPRSLLLLEDIDSVAVSRDRAAGHQGEISTSSLLNALDGVATPHGLITIMTTNHFGDLDPALTRAGRMDLVEEITPPSWAEVALLFEHFYDQPWPDLSGVFVGLTPDTEPPAMARVSETFKRHLEDPEAALRELLLLVDVRM